MADAVAKASIVTGSRAPTSVGVAWHPVLQVNTFQRQSPATVALSTTSWAKLVSDNPSRMGIVISFIGGPRTIALQGYTSDALQVPMDWPDPRPIMITSAEYPCMAQSEWWAVGGVNTVVEVIELLYNPKRLTN